MGNIKNFTINGNDLDDVVMIKPANITNLNYNCFFENINSIGLYKLGHLNVKNTIWEFKEPSEIQFPTDYQSLPLATPMKCKYSLTYNNSERTETEIFENIYYGGNPTSGIFLIDFGIAGTISFNFDSKIWHPNEIKLISFTDDAINNTIPYQLFSWLKDNCTSVTYNNVTYDLTNWTDVDKNVISLPTTNIPAKLYAAYPKETSGILEDIKKIQIERDENGLVIDYKDIEGNKLTEEQYMEWLSKVDYCKGQLKINGVSQPSLKKSNAFPLNTRQVDLLYNDTRGSTSNNITTFTYTLDELYNLTSNTQNITNSSAFNIIATNYGGAGGGIDEDLREAHTGTGGGAGGCCTLFIQIKNSSQSNKLIFKVANLNSNKNTTIEYYVNTSLKYSCELQPGPAGISNPNPSSEAASGVDSGDILLNNHSSDSSDFDSYIIYEDEYIYIELLNVPYLKLWKNNHYSGYAGYYSPWAQDLGGSGALTKRQLTIYTYTVDFISIYNSGGEAHEYGGGGASSMFGNGAKGGQAASALAYGVGGGGRCYNSSNGKGGNGGPACIRIIS